MVYCQPIKTKKEPIMSLEALRAHFPKTRRNAALTGYIPMDFFEDNEDRIRQIFKDLPGSYRFIYRGPRISNKTTSYYNKPSMTRRCDATHVLIYRR
jgi:hypothetical protein